jgi:hypothetical protein
MRTRTHRLAHGDYHNLALTSNGESALFAPFSSFADELCFHPQAASIAGEPIRAAPWGSDTLTYPTHHSRSRHRCLTKSPPLPRRLRPLPHRDWYSELRPSCLRCLPLPRISRVSSRAVSSADQVRRSCPDVTSTRRSESTSRPRSFLTGRGSFLPSTAGVAERPDLPLRRRLEQSGTSLFTRSPQAGGTAAAWRSISIPTRGRVRLRGRKSRHRSSIVIPLRLCAARRRAKQLLSLQRRTPQVPVSAASMFAPARSASGSLGVAQTGVQEEAV